ncbi:MAG TPA: pilus assembly protein TadG-related protein [Acidimicrobiia bacterium]|nr:pilus assembly protein TadG-related protein [Acidimicrobiia bacterium]
MTPRRRRPVVPRGEHGTITLWILGCCLMMLALGGISLDLWRAFSERRAIAAAADAAALSGASAIDEGRYRASAELVLVPETAVARARASLRQQLDTRAMRGADISVGTDAVTVLVHGSVSFSLLKLLGSGDFAVAVASTATPRRSP